MEHGRAPRAAPQGTGRLARSALTVLLALSLAPGCGPLSAGRSTRTGPGPSEASSEPVSSGRAPSSEDATNARIRAIIGRMTAEEKVGQLFMTYAWGATASAPDAGARAANQKLYGVDDFAGLLAKYHLGGVIYFPQYGNLKDPDQIAALSNGIQRETLAEGAAIPVLIATDQEGGIVSRIREPFTAFPGNMALGATGDPSLAERAAAITGAELRALGLNLNLAPDADVNVNPANPVIGVRSFGADPGEVAKMTRAAVAGYQSAGVAAAAKHFPGHGDTNQDSHSELPVIGHSPDEWRRVDLPPFQAAVEAGVDVVMTAHIVLPALDGSGRPATLSGPIITGLLRERLGFDGVIMTDSLQMAGVRQTVGDDRVPVEALKAGADLLLMPPDLGRAYASVLKAVADGEITRERLDASVYRILRLKMKLGLFDDPYADPALARSVGGVEHARVADEVAARAVTLLKNGRPGHPLLPLAAKGGGRLFLAGYPGSALDALEAALTDRGVGVTVVKTGSSPGRPAVDGAVQAARACRCSAAVVLTLDASPGSGQSDLVNAFLQAGIPTAAVAVRTPYDIAGYPDVDAYLATYSDQPVAMRALADVLTGAAGAPGRLPVSIPAAGDPATILYGLGAGSP